MKHVALIAVPVALLGLAACDTAPTTVTANTQSYDPMAAELANAAPVELPPALKSSDSFRCKDNSVVYVDFFQGDTQANIRLGDRTGVPTVLRAPAAGEPFVAEGYSLSGTGKSITLTKPGAGSQSCNA